MTCAVCSLIGKGIDSPLLPFVVVYGGYSVCEEHLRLWEANREMDWDELVELSSEPKVEVVAVDLPNLETDNEKHDALLKAVEEFNHGVRESTPSVAEVYEVLTETATDFQLESEMPVIEPTSGAQGYSDTLGEGSPPPDWDAEAEAAKDLEMDAAERASIEAAEADGTAPWIEPKKPAKKKRGRPKGKKKVK